MGSIRSRWAVFLMLLIATGLTLAVPGLDMALVARAIDYEDEVCHPVIQHHTDTVPPCLELVTIETLCTPNGTSPLALKAHQLCRYIHVMAYSFSGRFVADGVY